MNDFTHTHTHTPTHTHLQTQHTHSHSHSHAKLLISFLLIFLYDFPKLKKRPTWSGKCTLNFIVWLSVDLTSVQLQTGRLELQTGRLDFLIRFSESKKETHMKRQRYSIKQSPPFSLIFLYEFPRLKKRPTWTDYARRAVHTDFTPSLWFAKMRKLF